ncbi:MAG: TniQ family protein [Aulosira sp. DedQUE10]|nr:TniQ family protein [Aulosira sp. DedQUE10]
MGLRTSYVESLTSYVARLAEAHCIPTGLLVLSELAPLIKAGYAFKGSTAGGLEKIFTNQTQSINGMGIWTKKLINAVESLTLQNELSFLTMLGWTELIPQKGLLRPIRAWCPFCYNDWHRTKQILREPLIWSLNPVTICSYHHQLLTTSCPHCHKTNKVLAWTSRPGYCSRCGEWLGCLLEDELATNQTLTENELKWQIWVTRNVEDLISATPHLPSTLSKDKIANKFSTYLNSLTNGNITAFARLLGMGNVTVTRWCRGENLPELEALLQICNILKTSLLDFLTEESITGNLSDLNIKPDSNLKSKRKTGVGKICESEQVLHVLQAALDESPPRTVTEIAHSLGYRSCSTLIYYSSDLCTQISARYADYQKAKKLENIQRALQAEIESQESPPPPLYEVAKRIGWSVPALRRSCPELCDAIAARNKCYRQERRIKRIEKITFEVYQIALKLHTQGIEPTASRISEYLQKPRVILEEEVMAAVNKVRCELGWEK